jgi:hypothetical protein
MKIEDNQNVVDDKMEVDSTYVACIIDYMNDDITLDELRNVLSSLIEAEEFLACAGMFKAIKAIENKFNC